PAGVVLEPAAEGRARAEGAHAVVAGLGDREVVRDRLACRERAARRAALGERTAVDQLGALERQAKVPLGLPLRRDRDLVVALAREGSGSAGSAVAAWRRSGSSASE